MRLILWHTHPFIRQSPLALCLHGEGEGWCLVVFVRCVGGLAHLADDRNAFPLITSGSFDSGLPQLSLPNSHPAESPIARAFHSSGSGPLRVTDSSRPLCLSLPLTPLSKGPVPLPRQVLPEAISQPNDDHFHLCQHVYSCSSKLNNDAHSLTPSHALTIMVHINGSVTTPAASSDWLHQQERLSKPGGLR